MLIKIKIKLLKKGHSQKHNLPRVPQKEESDIIKQYICSKRYTNKELQHKERTGTASRNRKY